MMVVGSGGGEEGVREECLEIVRMKGERCAKTYLDLLP